MNFDRNTEYVALEQIFCVVLVSKEIKEDNLIQLVLFVLGWLH